MRTVDPRLLSRSLSARRIKLYPPPFSQAAPHTPLHLRPRNPFLFPPPSSKVPVIHADLLA